MNWIGKTLGNGRIDRRNFFAAAGALGLAAIVGQASGLETNDDGGGMEKHILTGNGEWTYRILTGWGSLPGGTAFGGTHGAVAQDNAGQIYVSTPSDTGVLVYTSDGKLVRKIAAGYP